MVINIRSNFSVLYCHADTGQITMVYTENVGTGSNGGQDQSSSDKNER